MPTSTQVDAILKDDYQEYTEQLNNRNWFLAQIENSRNTVQGRIARHAIHTGRSGGIGARREGVSLPAAGRQRHATVPVPVRWQTGRIQLTVQLMAMADGEPAAFVDALESEMNIQNDVMRDVNRQLFGTSNGVMATCGTTTTSATIQLLATTPLSAMRHFYPGRVIDVGTVASPQTVASNREITAVNVANRTITVSGATLSTTSSTHFIFNYNSGGASANTGAQDDGQSELTGLQTHVSASSILHTVDPSTTPIWASQVYSNSGTNRPVTDTMIDYAILANATEAGESINALVSNIGVFTAGKAVLSAYQRNIDELEFKGGFRGIKWATPGVSGSGVKELGWMPDFDCIPNTLYGLNMDRFVCHQISEGWKWMDDDGAILSRVSGELAYEAVLYTSLELANKQRNAHFVIQDLTEVTL
jgi:hypothetical protein